MSEDVENDEGANPKAELFRFRAEDRAVVDELIASVRLMLQRADLPPRTIYHLAIVLLALERLPLATKGVEAGVSLTYRFDSEMSYQGFYIGETSFRLDAGGVAYSPEVGSDSFGHDIFEVEVGGFRDGGNFMQVAGWLEQFRERATDKSNDISIEWLGDDTEVEWDEDEQEQDYWDKLDSEDA